MHELQWYVSQKLSRNLSTSYRVELMYDIKQISLVAWHTFVKIEANMLTLMVPQINFAANFHHFELTGWYQISFSFSSRNSSARNDESAIALSNL
jgi:hypothetical protein